MNLTSCSSNSTIALFRERWEQAQLLMAATSILMAILSFILLVSSITRNTFPFCAELNPVIHFFLFGTFSLFLPLMSYMYSQSKQSHSDPQQAAGGFPYLPAQAYLILLWMILLELMRKKVAAVLDRVRSDAPSPMAAVQGRSPWDFFDEAIRLSLIGYYIFTYDPTGDYHTWRWLLVLLWALAWLKMLHKSISLYHAKNSTAIVQNPQLVSVYMDEVIKQQPQRWSHFDGQQWLKACEFPVIGEYTFKMKATPMGYVPSELSEHDENKKKRLLVTVGHVWSQTEKHGGLSKNRAKTFDHPTYLCLSFALYKLLRRRLENCPMAEVHTRAARELILDGFGLGNDEWAFHVVELELKFLREYYYTFIPFALSNPLVFIANLYVVVAIAAVVFIVVIVVAFKGKVWKLFSVVGVLFDSIAGISRCISGNLGAYSALSGVFTIIDLLITVMLLFTLMYMEVAEFLLNIFSNWFIVSLICYSVRQKMFWLRYLVKVLLWPMQKLESPAKFYQLSFFQNFAHDLLPQQVSKGLGLKCVKIVQVPGQVKLEIMKALRRKYGAGLHNPDPPDRLSFSCSVRQGNISATEIILTWHIATALFFDKWATKVEEKKVEEKKVDEKKEEEKNYLDVAVKLSEYCLFLVAFEPELLPGEPIGSIQMYKDVRASLRKTTALCSSRCCGRHADWRERLCKPKEKVADGTVKEHSVVENAVKLSGELTEKTASGADLDRVCRAMAEEWADIMVDVAQSDNVEAHARSLANHVEFITYVWAMLTHMGVSGKRSTTSESSIPVVSGKRSTTSESSIPVDVP